MSGDLRLQRSERRIEHSEERFDLRVVPGHVQFRRLLRFQHRIERLEVRVDRRDSSAGILRDIFLRMKVHGKGSPCAGGIGLQVQIDGPTSVHPRVSAGCGYDRIVKKVRQRRESGLARSHQLERHGSGGVL